MHRGKSRVKRSEEFKEFCLNYRFMQPDFL